MVIALSYYSLSHERTLTLAPLPTAARPSAARAGRLARLATWRALTSLRLASSPPSRSSSSSRATLRKTRAATAVCRRPLHSHARTQTVPPQPPKQSTPLSPPPTPLPPPPPHTHMHHPPLSFTGGCLRLRHSEGRPCLREGLPVHLRWWPHGHVQAAV